MRLQCTPRTLPIPTSLNRDDDHLVRVLIAAFSNLQAQSTRSSMFMLPPRYVAKRQASDDAIRPPPQAGCLPKMRWRRRSPALAPAAGRCARCARSVSPRFDGAQLLRLYWSFRETARTFVPETPYRRYASVTSPHISSVGETRAAGVLKFPAVMMLHADKACTSPEWFHAELECVLE